MDYVADSAEAGSDYTTISTPLEFPAALSSDTTQCATVNITEDDTFEGDETFTVELSTTTPGVVEGNNVTTITITDNDG